MAERFDAAAGAQITDMGFSEPAAQRGLLQTGHNVERAVEWVMMHLDDENLNAPLPEPGADGGAGPPGGPGELLRASGAEAEAGARGEG